jgi:hypothetical protein
MKKITRLILRSELNRSGYNNVKIKAPILKAIIFLFFTVPTLLSAQNNADCNSAFAICELGSYHFKSLLGTGEVEENLSGLNCAQNDFREINSQWLKFKIEESGTLIFSINPEDDSHDIDFVLFKSNNFELSSLQEVRCMTSGQNLGTTLKSKNDCLGSTGLNMTSRDIFESSGCKYNDDNYLKFLKAKVGEEYVLFINDYHDKGSISVTLEGTAQLSPLESCKKKYDTELQVLNVYPSPAQNEISVELSSNNDSQIVIDILDMNSRLVYTESSSIVGNRLSKKLDVQNLGAGSYILRTRQGKQVAVKSFIKI